MSTWYSGTPSDSLLGATLTLGGYRVKVKQRIAEGGFGYVYLVKDRDTKQPYALKRILCDGDESLEGAQREIRVYVELGKHPNVVSLLAHEVSTLNNGRIHQVMMLMEHCAGGHVKVPNTRPGPTREVPMPMGVCVRILYDTAQALRHLHTRSPPMAHRDIKPENVLLHADGTYKLCDFGSVSQVKRRPESQSARAAMEAEIQRDTSAAYRPPEMWDLFRGHDIWIECDLWALGCMAYYLSFGVMAFDGNSKMAVLNHTFKPPQANGRVPSAMVSLIKQLLVPDPSRRPDISHVCTSLEAIMAGLSDENDAVRAQAQGLSIVAVSQSPSEPDRKYQSAMATTAEAGTGAEGSSDRDAPYNDRDTLVLVPAMMESIARSRSISGIPGGWIVEDDANARSELSPDVAGKASTSSPQPASDESISQRQRSVLAMRNEAVITMQRDSADAHGEHQEQSKSRGAFKSMMKWYSRRTMVNKATDENTIGAPKAKHLRKMILSSWKLAPPDINGPRPHQQSTPRDASAGDPSTPNTLEGEGASRFEENNMAAVDFFTHLGRRPIINHVVCCIKSLVVIHRMLLQGSPLFADEALRNITVIDRARSAWSRRAAMLPRPDHNVGVSSPSTAADMERVTVHLCATYGVYLHRRIELLEYYPELSKYLRVFDFNDAMEPGLDELPAAARAARMASQAPSKVPASPAPGSRRGPMTPRIPKCPAESAPLLVSCLEALVRALDIALPALGASSAIGISTLETDILAMQFSAAVPLLRESPILYLLAAGAMEDLGVVSRGAGGSGSLNELITLIPRFHQLHGRLRLKYTKAQKEPSIFFTLPAFFPERPPSSAIGSGGSSAKLQPQGGSTSPPTVDTGSVFSPSSPVLGWAIGGTPPPIQEDFEMSSWDNFEGLGGSTEKRTSNGSGLASMSQTTAIVDLVDILQPKPTEDDSLFTFVDNGADFGGEIPGRRAQKQFGQRNGDGLANPVGLSSDHRTTPRELALQYGICEIPFGELAVGKMIGKGTFGDVVFATWQGTNVAVKLLKNAKPSREQLQEFKREVAMLHRLRHPNIILFMGACMIPPDMAIVMEYAERGSLYHVLRDRAAYPSISFPLVVRMATETARGMHYLHSRSPPVLHRDLKSVNLLVDYEWHIKVSDFGLALTKATSFVHTQVGTWNWMAPEVLNNRPYGEKADVYSFGMVLWELLTREEPFKGMHPMQIMKHIDAGKRLEIPQDAHPGLRTMILACWDADPSKRPTFEQILADLSSL